MDKVNNLQSDLDALEEALGQEHIEMYLRQLKMELRCARSLADEQVKVLLLKINVSFNFIALGRTIRTSTREPMEMANLSYSVLRHNLYLLNSTSVSNIYFGYNL